MVGGCKEERDPDLLYDPGLDPWIDRKADPEICEDIC
jgi:hypothetical protein